MHKKRTVVVAEDESVNRMDLVAMLEDNGYEVVGEAANGEEAVDLTEYHGGADNKCTILDGMRKRMSLEWQEIAYLGDDWVDLAPMSRVGLPAAVANAMPDVKKLAKFVTQKEGGCGAVREFVDLLLTCQGKREALLEHWMRLE